MPDYKNAQLDSAGLCSGSASPHRIALRYAFVLAWVVLAGCTPYMREGVLGGYRDYALPNDQHHISVQGNGYVNSGRMTEYFYRRAAEIVAEQGYTGYEVLSLRVSSEPWGGMCCFPVVAGVIQGKRDVAADRSSNGVAP